MSSTEMPSNSMPMTSDFLVLYIYCNKHGYDFLLFYPLVVSKAIYYFLTKKHLSYAILHLSGSQM